MIIMYLTICLHVSIITRGSVLAREFSLWDSEKEGSLNEFWFSLTFVVFVVVDIFDCSGGN